VRLHGIDRLGLDDLERFATENEIPMTARANYLRGLYQVAAAMAHCAETAYEKHKKVLYLLTVGGLNAPAESLGVRTDRQDSILATMGVTPSADAVGCWPALLAEYAKRKDMSRDEAYNCVRAVVVGLRTLGPPEDVIDPREHALSLCRQVIPKAHWSDIGDWLDQTAQDQTR
jgi:hypothetical protein